MQHGKFRAWRIPLIVFAFVCIGIISFGVIQFWSKGHIPETDVIDLSLTQTIQQNNHRATLKPQIEEPYHYDFFTLLEQPVPERELTELDLEQNPAIKAKARHSLNKISGKYAIQVSSYKNASDAQTLVRQLNVEGYHAVIMTDSVDGQNWYRVRVDGGSKKEQAETLQANIAKKTGMKGLVVAL
ncbi:MAG: SPOR domain-containing protein [Proteobacteria bacterium]|nr:SPOR domain-containing protein [Pseudomonadota bacterium]